MTNFFISSVTVNNKQKKAKREGKFEQKGTINEANVISVTMMYTFLLHL